MKKNAILFLAIAFIGCVKVPPSSSEQTQPSHEQTPSETVPANSFQKEPYAQHVTPDSVVIMWQAKEPARTEVVLMETGAETVSGKKELREMSRQVTLGEIKISGLVPGARYNYKVKLDDGTSSGGTFVTPNPKSNKVRFVAYGDTRTNPKDHKMVVDGITAAKPEFVLHTGDLVSNGRNDGDWDSQFFGPAAIMLQSTVLFPTPGNHEREADYYYQYFSLPGNEKWYSFDWGNCHVVSLDSCVDIEPGSEQNEWLKNDLKQSGAEWKILFFHHPLYSAYSGRSSERKEMRSDLENVLLEGGVDIVFNGHDHLYSRTGPVTSIKYPGKAITYVVTGGGGAPLYKPMQVSWAVTARDLNYCIIDVDDGRFNLTALTPEGKQIDAFTITKKNGIYSKDYMSKSLPRETIELVANTRETLDTLNAGTVEIQNGTIKTELSVKLNNPSETDARLSGAWTTEGNWTVVPQTFVADLPAGMEKELKFSLESPKGEMFPVPSLKAILDTSVSGKMELGEGKLRIRLGRSVTVPAIKTAPAIDGAINPGEWDGTAEQEYFVKDSGDGYASKQAKFYAAHDGKNIYIACVLSEPSPGKIKHSAEKRDSAQVWQDDCVEVFADPGITGKDYFQFIVSATGVQFDSRNKDSSWNGTWQSAAITYDDKWVCEIAIPFKTLGLEKVPATEDKWGLNVVRNDTVSDECSQWSATFGNNHKPELFGVAEFGE